YVSYCFFFSSRRRHTRFSRDWSSDVCSSDLYRPSPSLDGLLPRSRQGKLVGRGIPRQGGAGPDGRAGTDRDRRHQIGARANEGTIADDSTVLIGAIVVAGDGARADVDVGADIGVADVAEMVDLGTPLQARRLDLHEIADPGPLL